MYASVCLCARFTCFCMCICTYTCLVCSCPYLIYVYLSSIQWGGGREGTKFTEYIRDSTRGWWVPFIVIELVPRVLILQIIGQ